MLSKEHQTLPSWRIAASRLFCFGKRSRRLQEKLLSPRIQIAHMKGNEFQLLYRRIGIDRAVIARVEEDANVDQGGNQRIAIHSRIIEV